MDLTVEEAEEMLATHLRLYHSITPDDVVITDTKGYWRMKKLCDETCHNPIHTCLGCEGVMYHTVQFVQYGRNDKGQFRSPYRVWKVLYDNENKNMEVK